MENLIEKLKTVDKKVWIGVGIGAAVLIIAIVALVIAGGNKPAGGNTQGTQAGTETEGATEVFGTEDVTEVLGTEMATEMGTETEMTESESQYQNNGGGQGSNGGGTTSNVTVTQPEAVDGVEQKPVTTTPDGQEILGLGSKSEPYEVLSEATASGVTITTVEVPAGKTLYYKINKIGGLWLNVDDPDLYVIDSRDNRHDSGFQVEKKLASEFVLLQIGNKSGTNKAFTIRFTNVPGSYQNPTKLDSLSATTDVAYGNDVGYYYQFEVKDAGTILFYIDSSTHTSGISVTNKRNTMNRTFSADAKQDSQGRKYIQLDGVQPGDVLLINIYILPDQSTWEYPATTVVWHGEYK